MKKPDSVSLSPVSASPSDGSLRQRATSSQINTLPALDMPVTFVSSQEERRKVSWRRILLLIVAITIHNIPGSVF